GVTLRVPCSDGNIAEETEPHPAHGSRVVARRSYCRERVISLATEYCIDRPDHPARREPRHVIRHRRDVGIRIEQHRLLRIAGCNLSCFFDVLDIAWIMDARKLFDACRGRRHSL